MEAVLGCIRWGGGGAVWQNVGGKGGTPRSRNQEWWTEEVAKAVGEKRGATTHQLKAPVWPDEEGSHESG